MIIHSKFKIELSRFVDIKIVKLYFDLERYSHVFNKN